MVASSGFVNPGFVKAVPKLREVELMVSIDDGTKPKVGSPLQWLSHWLRT